MSKILTVSIAAYNVEKTIRQALDSIVSEEIINDIEILVIDDGGKDSTMDIAKEYESRFPQSIKLVHKDNGGYGSVINAAIKLSTGKYFKQLDGDDWFDANHFVAFVNLLKSIDVDFVHTPRITVNESDGSRKTTDFLPNEPEGKKEFANVDFKKGIGMHASTFRTEILKNMKRRITEHCFYTDVELVYFPLPDMKTMFISHTPLYMYRVGIEGQSVSKTGVRKHYKEHEKVLWHLLEVYEEMMSDCQSKRDLIKARIKDEICGQYIFYGMLETNKSHKKEMKQFDLELQRRCPSILSEVMNYSRYVWLLRKTHFVLYPFMDSIRNLIP